MRLPPQFTAAVSNAGAQFYGAAVYSAPGTGCRIPAAPSRSTPIFVQTCPKGGIWTQKRFLFHRGGGDFSLTLSKKSRGRIPVPQSGTRPAPSADGAVLT